MAGRALRSAAVASQSRSSIVELQTCRTAHAKTACSQVIFWSVHFPAELAAAPAVCMLRWLSKEGTGRALIQLRRFRGVKAGRKITNFDICCSLQVSLIIAWRDVKVHRHDPELQHTMAALPPVPPLSHRQEWQNHFWHTRKSWFLLLSRREHAVIQPRAAISRTCGREGGNSSLGKECCSVGQWF